MGKKKRKKELDEAVEWIREASVYALSVEVHASPTGDSRELPACVPTENEWKAFCMGIGYGLCLAETRITSFGRMTEKDPAMNVVKVINGHMRRLVEESVKGGAE